MIPRHNIQRVVVQRMRSGQLTRQADVVAVEEPLEIRLTWYQAGQRVEQSLSVTMRTPGDDFELAAGFLVSEGIVREAGKIDTIRYCVDDARETQAYNVLNVHLRPGVSFDPARLLRHFYTTSSCGVCGKASLEALDTLREPHPALLPDRPVVNQEVLHSIDSKLRKAQAAFAKTGGLHAAGLFNTAGELISLREDVGRHNAMDKLVGEQYLAGNLPLSSYLLMVSGRTSFEIMQKALMAGLPIVAAVGAPSSLAIDVARQYGLTLLGFVRGGSFNIYTGAQRIGPASG